MGKKQKSRNCTSPTPHPNPLTQAVLINSQKPLKQYLWQCLQKSIISMKTQTILREYINKATGGSNIESELQEKLDKKQVYEKTKKIFRGPSLKQKYRKLLIPGTHTPAKQEEESKVDKEQLTDQENKELCKIEAVFSKYRVCSMFRSSILKALKIKKIEILDSLIGKGYLKEKESKDCKSQKIILLSNC